jgi:hypothetical protein
MIRSMKTALSAAALGAVGLLASRASAQMAHIPENDWRQEDRHDALAGVNQKQQFYIEVRLGAYLPTGIDNDPKLGGKTPFADVFSLDCSASPLVSTGSVSHRFYFGLEADYVPLRIPYVGGLGVGVGWGYTRFSNNARFTGGNTCSAETTALTIMPMYATTVLRVDELMRRTGIPIVPYGKFGVGVQYWRASNDSGAEHVCQGKDGSWTTSACADSGATVAGSSGLTPTLHFAVGGMISLNFLEPRSTAKLGESTGVGHVYVFGELYADTVPLATNVLRVGNTSWAAGVAVDF